MRDFLLGLEMIDGHGNSIKAGGRVVKNVTGYDICKLLSGSFGTLGVLTEICVKVWPKPETGKTLVVHGQNDADAVASMLKLASLPCEITGLAHLSDRPAGNSRTMIRVEGPAPSVTDQIEKLAGLAGGEQTVLAAEPSAIAWRSLRELEPLTPGAEEELWRFAIPSTDSARLIETLRKYGLLQLGLDWGGGLVWCLFPSDVQPATLHDAAQDAGATAWRFATASADVNDAAFSPLAVGVRRLNKLVKEAFDPRGIFNPGRMYS